MQPASGAVALSAQQAELPWEFVAVRAQLGGAAARPGVVVADALDPLLAACRLDIVNSRDDTVIPNDSLLDGDGSNAAWHFPVHKFLGGGCAPRRMLARAPTRAPPPPPPRSASTHPLLRTSSPPLQLPRSSLCRRLAARRPSRRYSSFVSARRRTGA